MKSQTLKSMNITLAGMQLEPRSINEACAEICEWAKSGKSGHVITTNAQHLYLYKHDLEFKRAYDGARLRVIDGRPIRLLARMLSIGKTPMCPGSDLIFPLCKYAAQERLTVGIIGASDRIAKATADFLMAAIPSIVISGTWAAPRNLKGDVSGAKQLAADISETKTDILFIGVGAPTQELWANEYLLQTRAHAILCIGAGLEFLIGEKARAPRWVRRLGVEAAWRFAQEPRRLGGRYTLAGFELIKAAAAVIYSRISARHAHHQQQ